MGSSRFLGLLGTFLGCTVAFVFLFSRLHQFGDVQSISDRPIALIQSVFKSEPAAYLSAVKSCILDKISEDFWERISPIIGNCSLEHSRVESKDLIRFHMGRFQETKTFLRPTSTIEDCRWLTIGIGGDTEVENEFHQQYPDCDIFGIEAAPDQVADFNRFGTVIPFGIGTQRGKLKMKLRQPNGKYKQLPVEIYPMTKLFDQHIKSRLIHFMTIDLEGFEYTILSALSAPNGTFADSGIVFCQIDAELHTPEWKEPSFDFGAFFRDFLQGTPYVPIAGQNFLRHRKVTFVYGKPHPVCDRSFPVAGC